VVELVTADSRADLSISVAESPGVVRVALGGELDLSNIEVLSQALEPYLSGSPAVMIFDLTDLRFLDSSGIGLVLGAVNRCGEVRIQRPSEIVRQVVEYMGLADILRIEP
jgi:anti-anti-sigma factor